MSYKFTKSCLKFSSVAILLLFLQTVHAQSKKNSKELGLASFAGLDALIMKDQKAFGTDLAALVWTDTLVYKHELGEFDSRTLVPIGSASQWLTTALVLKMAEEGKISLDDKVAQYLPVFESYGKSYVTIRHCLTHFTGISTDGKLLQKKHFGSLEDEVSSYAKKEIKTNAGTEFYYSSMGFSIAGRILEIVTKKKFDMLIKQKLLNPLQMRKTTFSTLDGSAIDPAGGAQSTAEEYMRFLQMLLNKGSYHGQQILSEASINELRQITADAGSARNAPKSVTGFSYAMGSWAVEEGTDHKASALTSPSFTGTWPLVNWSRGYAFLLFTKELSDEGRKETYMALKDEVDGKR